MDLKSAEQMDILTMIQLMEKFPEFYESSSSSEAANYNRATPYYMENPNAVFPSYNLQSIVSTNNITNPVQPPYSSAESQKQNSMAAMREMIYRIAAMQPIYIDPEAVKPPKRRNVKISKDPQSVAARHRRERISEKIRILQRIVPGGTKMDTASMLDEAIHYVKFLKSQVQSLEMAAANRPKGFGFPVSYVSNGSKPSQIGERNKDDASFAGDGE